MPSIQRSTRIRNPSNSRFQKTRVVSSNIQLDKIFRLYSPDNIIKSYISSNKSNKKQQQKTIIQLVFPHPNILFIHPQKIKDQTEKQAFMQFNMIKNIVDRKGQNTSIKSSRNHHHKPMTAPSIGRRPNLMKSQNYLRKSQKEEGINICNLICGNQNTNLEQFSSTFVPRKSKVFTSKSKFRKSCNILKQNMEQMNEKSFQNQIINRNTFDFKLQQKKKVISRKFQQDKLMRQKLYKNVVKSPKTQMYILMEGKFSKYFNKN